VAARPDLGARSDAESAAAVGASRRMRRSDDRRTDLVNISAARVYRIFCRIAIGAGLWAIVAALLGDDPTRDGTDGLPLGSAHYALVLATASGLLAWTLSLASVQDESSPPRRGSRFVALLAVMVIAVNFLLMAQPSPPPPPFFACQDVNSIGHGFRHFLNCDSPTYMAMASDPRLVLTHTILQNRPLSFVLPFLISQPLRVVTRLEKAGAYRPYAREFIAYLIVNLACLLATLICFTWTLEAGTRRIAGIELLFACVALSANDVTKLFFWTPHTQIFNLLVPCMSVYLTFRLLQREKPLKPRAAFGWGLVLGLGLLIYGSFAVIVLCVSAIQLLVYRRPGPTLLVIIGALLPYVCWAAFVYSLSGSFYNHEVTRFRQFVWIIDCARQGIATCLPVATNHLQAFVNTAAPVVAVPAVLAFVCRLARHASPGTAAAPEPAPALAQAIALTLAVT
jgi:hypothetical protein